MKVCIRRNGKSKRIRISEPQVIFTFIKCKNTTSITSKWQHIRIANAPIPISSDRCTQRFEERAIHLHFDSF